MAASRPVHLMWLRCSVRGQLRRHANMLGISQMYEFVGFSVCGGF